MKKNEILTAFFLAKKNITGNKITLFLIIFIISLGFISSIIVYGILNDTDFNIQENFIETISGHIIIEPYSNNDKIENIDFVEKKLKTISNIQGVSSVSRRIMTILDNHGKTKGIEVYIIDPREFSEVSILDDLIIDGEFLNKGEKGKIVMGCLNVENCNKIKAYDSLDIEIGEKVKTYTLEKNIFNLTLQGVYQHRFIEIELINFITKETAEYIYSDYNKNESDFIIIKLPDRESAEIVKEEIINLNLNAKVSDWKETTSKHNSTVESFNVIGDLSFLIGVIISAISVYIILYINIINKKRQIGIIKGIGISSEMISFSYLLLSIFLGLFGCFFGVILTMILIQYFNSYPIVTGIGDLVPNISIETYFIISITITLASVFSGYLVSKRITKQNIISSIYHG